MSKIGVALVGYGTIGTGVIEILQDNSELIKQRTGTEIELLYVVDKDLTTKRRVEIRGAKLISDYKTALQDEKVNVVIELVGGTGFAYQLIEESLSAGKNVVTANKALLAERGAALFKLAEEKKKVIGFEASVCGGIPIIRTISDALAGDSITSIFGIVNGTTNYILTKMFEENLDFDTALKQAQNLGFAEADPTLDIGGHDAAHKLAILAEIAFNTPIDYKKVHAEGIQKIQLEDVKNAEDFGYVMKLIAIAKKHPDNMIEVRVNPTLVPQDNQLASVRNEFNAVLLCSQYLTNSMYFGRGAGSLPTATAVVSDLIDIAIFSETPSKTSKHILFNNYGVMDMGEIKSKYYVRFHAMDIPGVLSKISGIFGNHQISIASVIQKDQNKNNFVPLIMTTHLAKEKNILQALKEIETLDIVSESAVLIRILE